MPQSANEKATADLNPTGRLPDAIQPDKGNVLSQCRWVNGRGFRPGYGRPADSVRWTTSEHGSGRFTAAPLYFSGCCRRTRPVAAGTKKMHNLLASGIDFSV